MLTRDTCRSVDFTAWRVCPHTHVYTHIYIYTHIYVRSFSKGERNLVFIRARGTSTGSGSSSNARGRSESGRGRVLHACVHVASRDVSRFRASLYIYARLYMVTYGRVGECVIALGGSRGGGKLRETDRVETDDR